MQNQNSNVFEFNVVSPDAEKITVPCDSVCFQIRDNLEGEGGGSYGVHIGHVKSVLAMRAGKVEAKLADKTVWCGDCKEGFVKVTPISVTVVTEGFTVE